MWASVRSGSQGSSACLLTAALGSSQGSQLSLGTLGVRSWRVPFSLLWLKIFIVHWKPSFGRCGKSLRWDKFLLQTSVKGKEGERRGALFWLLCSHFVPVDKPCPEQVPGRKYLYWAYLKLVFGVLTVPFPLLSSSPRLRFNRASVHYLFSEMFFRLRSM